jgi:perosamine synthetase
VTELKEPMRSRIGLTGYDAGEPEVQAIREVIRSGILTNGPRTRAFEEAFARRHQVDHAVAVANGTVGLAAIYLGLGIGPGDEVIVPSMTFISTATSVVHVGATPIFADVDDMTFGLDVRDVKRRLTSRTRAIVAVHYGGQAANLAELGALADAARVLLIEDAAQAHGSMYRGKPVGGYGRAAMFSFTPTKNMTTGEGGMVTTNDPELAERIRLLRNHGQTAPYMHVLLGFNWRMTEMQAAMGIAQLARLDGILARKRANAQWMKQRLGSRLGLRLPVVMPDRDHPYMLYTLLVDRCRDAVLEHLQAAQIDARLYFPPAHRQPIFGRDPPSLPVTDELAARMLSIPFHSKLRLEELERIAISLEQAVEVSGT